jgi:hypothetical protein
MSDDTVTTTWKRFTDRVKGFWGPPADERFGKTSPAVAPPKQDKDGTLRPSDQLPAAMPHSDPRGPARS